jgi:hypothetical protein
METYNENILLFVTPDLLLTELSLVGISGSYSSDDLVGLLWA